jgi:CheY-like chemotaxis protein
VSSEGEGRGSTFRISLPLITDSQPRLPAAKPSRLAAKRILVVDDNVDAATSLSMVLELEGHRVEIAHHGLEALERVTKSPVDIVLLDIGLPQLDGYEVARRMRALPGGREMKIVALTGYGQPEDRARTLGAGFDDHLVKPVELGALARSLEALGSQTPARTADIR